MSNTSTIELSGKIVYVLIISPCPGCGHFETYNKNPSVFASFDEAKNGLIEALKDNYKPLNINSKCDNTYYQQKLQKYIEKVQNSESNNGEYILNDGNDAYTIVQRKIN